MDRLIDLPSGVVHLRRARPEDALALSRMHNQAWRESYSKLLSPQFLAALNDEDRAQAKLPGLKREWEMAPGQRTMVLAEADHSIAGFVSVGAVRDDALKSICPGELYSLYLLRARQGLGLGRALMEAAQAALLDLGYTHWGLWVWDQNPTRRFYERAGLCATELIKVELFGGNSVPHVAYQCLDVCK